MKWRKLGQIFNPADHVLFNECVEYAQSPQVLVFEDYVRIYFSTRRRDTSGKFLSHISFVDMDKQFNNTLGVAQHTVIELGALGSFDEHGIFPFNVCLANDKILAYTTGWNRRASVSTDAAIGLARSADNGKTFQKVGLGPVLNASLHEPFLVGDAFVLHHNDNFHMWYIHGTRWTQSNNEPAPQRVYKIAYACSADGIAWVKQGRQLISDVLNPDECQALPTVSYFDGRFHMFFCYREATDFRKNRFRGYRLGYAFSDNLTSWQRDDANVGIALSNDGWDSEMMCYPHVFKLDDEVYLLYNGNEFGRHGFGIAKLEK